MAHFVDGGYLRAFGAAGVVSFADEQLRAKEYKRIYLIKGARGALCAGLLGEVYRLLKRAGEEPMRILSGRRQGRTEGILLPQRHTVLIDAAYPNAIEPRFPVATEITVDTDALIEAPTLRASGSAVALADRVIDAEERRLERYLAAIGSLWEDTGALISSFIREDKIARYAAGFASRELPRKAGKGNVNRVFLSSLALREISDGALIRYPRLIAVEDAYGASAGLIFDALTREALGRGLDAILCPSPLLPGKKTDLLLLPDAGTAFFCTSGTFCALPDAERTVHTARFLDRDALSARKTRLAFNKKALRELSRGAFETAERVSDLQDVIDRFYISAADLDKMRSAAEEIVGEIGKF
ncbi:MAG: hypothetical protein IJK23_05900 [Clostridia bacterium]|nr:hypothetical protein [Clostridia bacterium]